MRCSHSSLYAALDPTTGKVIGRLHSRHRAIEFKRFLQTLDREVPAHLDVHLVLDNSSTHKTPAIQRWIAAHPRFVLHFTPTSSSWLNLVERWFAELTNKLLRRGAHRSVRQLNTDIRAWIDAPHLLERDPPEEQRIRGVALLSKRRLDVRYIVLAAGGVEPALGRLDDAVERDVLGYDQVSQACASLAGSRRLALSVFDAEVPDERDRVALGIADGG